MKRWTTLSGRGGTVLITISLALFLVSLIPQTQLGTSGGRMHVPREQVYIPEVVSTLTPQQGLQVTVTVEGTLDIYLLEVSIQELYEGSFNVSFNVTDLQELLETNPDLVIWHYEANNGNYDRHYVPTKVTNATLVFSNPSSDDVTVDFEIAITSGIAPGDKVRNIALWTTPIGFILAIPWLANLWKQRKQR
jgi:hypothetical protein